MHSAVTESTGLRPLTAGEIDFVSGGRPHSTAVTATQTFSIGAVAHQSISVSPGDISVTQTITASGGSQIVESNFAVVTST